MSDSPTSTFSADVGVMMAVALTSKGN